MGSITGTSAAQNGPVIHICSQCGALLLEDAPTCLFCDSPITDTPELAAVAATPDSPPARSAAARSSAPASSIVVEPEWRIEVSRRLAEYRRRRGHLIEDDSQSGLPFAEERVLEDDLDRLPSPTPAEAPRTAGRVSARARQTERLDICVQPELDFSTAASNRARPQTALVPVASLAERRSAAVLDAVFLTLTYAGFVGLFRSLGGQLMFQKIDAAVCLSTLFLFYCLYFSLFTTFAGATPGMMLRGLTIVRLDGSLPDTRQLLWRSFGYMLSSATLFLGFLWALWDEDRFTWQDRISQTYVTSTEPLIHAASLDSPAVRHGFAHK
ncbi:MAG TPA: RDD family protein [Candidatus Acidoferrum sp.]|nr:RDD family protein [Candidatus Acidoferrum sp.]